MNLMIKLTIPTLPVFTLTNIGNDDHHNTSLFGSYLGRDTAPKTTKFEEHEHEEGHNLDQSSIMSHHKGGSILSGHNIKSLDYLESPSRDSDYRSSASLRDVESEIDEIKKDIEVETDPNLHLI
jgi:hypothetical protein